jgi:uncharacterized Ntn-hydrolase superfamily protein
MPTIECVTKGGLERVLSGTRDRHLTASTFSIVAVDRSNLDLGVAVASKFPAVGAIVPWARALVGAIATQAMINVSYGPNGLRLLEEGLSADETLRRLVADDPEREIRQVAIVDRSGNVAAHTGKECLEWKGHLLGSGYSCQGNLLASSRALESMSQAYEETTGDLIDRLLAALTAGQAAGGDRRGKQSAAILVVRKDGGYGGYSDRYLDLRVDDHSNPIEELKRVFRNYDITMLSRENQSNLLEIDNALTVTIQRNLKKLGFYNGDVTGNLNAATKKALDDFVNINNFEDRMRQEGKIWKSILDYMERQATASSR